MDAPTLVGALVLLLVFLSALLGYAADAYQAGLLVIVVLGGLGATLIACRWEDLKALLRLPGIALFGRGPDPRALVTRIVGYAETARRLGILALEREAPQEPSPFLCTGIRLAVDGTKPRVLRTILETELTFIEERHRRARDTVRVLAASWLALGGIAALGVLGLRTGYVGGAAAVEEAALALLYGSVLALVAMALRRKLTGVSDEEAMQKRMIIEGILSLQAGDNPRIIEQKLCVFLAPKLRPAIPPEPDVDLPPVPDPEPAEAEFRAGVSDVIAKVKGALPEERGDEPDAWTLHDLLALIQPATRRDILASIGEAEPPPSLPSYDIEVITRLTDREVQVLLREADIRDLIVALKSASDAVRDRIFANVSERVGRMLKENLATDRLASVTIHQAVDSQLTILRTLQRLEARNIVTSAL